MNQAITLNGIEQAVINLPYRNEKALKYRLVQLIKTRYEDEKALTSLPAIEPDELIKALWDTGNSQQLIRNKRKNLSSIKSAVNADLKKLYDKGQNPEGILIGPKNIFVMSDDAKHNMLTSFLDQFGGDKLNKIRSLMNYIDKMIFNQKTIAEQENSDAFATINEFNRLIQNWSGDNGLGKQNKMSWTGYDGDTGQTHEEVAEEEELHISEDDEVLELEDEEGEAEEIIEEVSDQEEIDEVEELEEADEGLDLEAVDEDDPIDEVENEEEIEELDENEISEEIAAEDSLEVVDEEEIIEDIGSEDGLEPSDFEEEKIEKARILADEFNQTLAAMDRYYNQYILIPGREYVLGDTKRENGIRSGETAVLSPYYMGRFPVTNALFEVFVEKTGYKTTAEKLGYGTVYSGRYQKQIDEKTGMRRINWNSALKCKEVGGAFWYQPSGSGSTLHGKRNHPVVQVSLEDAMAFAAWTGKRLPTEDEWEASSRTGNGYQYPWGNEWKEEVCNLEGSFIGDTSPVDMFTENENEFGIADALGNVFEWTLTKSAEPSTNGQGANIIKGSSWVSGNDVYLFDRQRLEPEAHSNILGFRCVAY
ncbi:formylglycine-generating enzyme family protein [Thermodesulfobacteriota bacterium]